MKKNRKAAIGLALVCVLTATAGCGQKVLEPAEEIELIEPVNAVSGTEAAAYRNLYNYRVLSGYIYPYIREYSLPVSAYLEEYYVSPGDAVAKGDVLLTADDSRLQEEIAGQEEAIRQAEDSYREAQKNTQDEIAAINDEIRDLTEQIKALGAGAGTMTDRLDNQIALCRLRIEQKQLTAKHDRELYELESSYNVRHLARLRQQESDYVLTSPMSGTIVSAGDTARGSWIAADAPLVAVADYGQKTLRCDYLSQSEIKKCADLYAFVNGERYEVEYQPYDTTEYNRLLKNGTVYSTFLIDDPQGKIQIGDFAVLAEIYSRKEHVLSVPKKAIRRDQVGHFVYRYEDGEPVLTRVRIGETDGTYTEITEGLSEGDEVLLTENHAYVSGSAKVERGTFANSFEADGYMGFPMMDIVTNPIKNGTTFFVEYNVQRFASVKKGDVIATVRVEGDEIALYQKQTELKRQQERLKDAKEAGNELEQELRQSAADRLQEEISEIKKDYAATEIVTETDGIIVWLADIPKKGTIAPDAVIAFVADEEKNYITVNDERNQLVLGNRVTVQYTTEDYKQKEAEGVVVTASSMAVSERLVPQSVYIQLPKEVISGLSAVSSTNALGFLDRTTYKVTAETRRMGDVLVIPKAAVWSNNGNEYVFVRGSDGKVTARSFIAGGYNASQYWVLEGLEEGMELCLE